MVLEKFYIISMNVGRKELYFDSGLWTIYPTNATKYANRNGAQDKIEQLHIDGYDSLKIEILSTELNPIV